MCWYKIEKQIGRTEKRPENCTICRGNTAHRQAEVQTLKRHQYLITHIRKVNLDPFSTNLRRQDYFQMNEHVPAEGKRLV